MYVLKIGGLRGFISNKIRVITASPLTAIELQFTDFISDIERKITSCDIMMRGNESIVDFATNMETEM
jgi:hypothetical protein